jgi:nicotinamide phosphoribosyltransferase
VPEGTVLNKGNVLVTVENTDEEFPWLTSYIETALLRAVWYPTTVATVSREAKRVIKTYLDLTCDNPDVELPFKLHDFGARGVSSYESAGIGGAAHLVNFMGTDTVPALDILKTYYGANMPAFSIPAMEHSTVCSWGREAEAGAYYNMVGSFGKEGSILACVSDSYNIYEAVRDIWCSSNMKKLIKDRGCTVVIRPDSGHPPMVVTKILNILEEKFGMYKNNKGYKVLNDGFKLIQGDGINLEMIGIILFAMRAQGYSAENIAFGMGAGLLQNLNRDTLSFAMKASAVKRAGNWIPIGKSPITDKGKSQKFGRLTLRRNETGEWYTSNDFSWQDKNLMWPAFINGEVRSCPTLEDIRKRAAI